MGFRDDSPDVEIVGVSMGPRGKATMFRPDFDMGQEGDCIFVPTSQCDFIPEPDASEEGRGTLFVRAWLAKKEGWESNG